MAAPLLSLATPAARLGIRILGQLSYGYGRGPAARDASPKLAHGPRPGRRVGDAMVTIDDRAGSLHQTLAAPGMHLLLVGFPEGGPTPHLAATQVHRLRALPGGAAATGYLLVRPDGYVGLRCGGLDLAPLRRLLNGWR